MLPALVEQWLRSLPKQIRKHLAPLPDKMPAILDRLLSRSRFRQGRLHTALAQVVADLYEVQVNPKDWVDAQIESHLHMNIKVLDEDGTLLAQDRDPAVEVAAGEPPPPGRPSARRLQAWRRPAHAARRVLTKPQSR